MEGEVMTERATPLAIEAARLEQARRAMLRGSLRKSREVMKYNMPQNEKDLLAALITPGLCETVSLADRVKFLEADNAKLSAENVQVCLLLSIAAHPCAQSSTAGALLDALTRGMCWEWAVGGTFQLETAD